MRTGAVKAYAFFVKNVGKRVTPAAVNKAVGDTQVARHVFNIKDTLGVTIKAYKDGRTVVGYELEALPETEPQALKEHNAKLAARKAAKEQAKTAKKVTKTAKKATKPVAKKAPVKAAKTTKKATKPAVVETETVVEGEVPNFAVDPDFDAGDEGIPDFLQREAVAS